MEFNEVVNRVPNVKVCDIIQQLYRKDKIMEIFTDIEKRILESTNKKYKWIARDENGRL